MSDGSGLARLSRRRLVRHAVAAGAAFGLGSLAAAPTEQASGGAPAFGQTGAVIFALKEDDAAKVWPLVEDYRGLTGVAVEIEPHPYDSLLETLTINLTQATGAYDVVSMDDPWLPYFAGGEYLRNLDDLMDEQGIEPDADFLPELLPLGEFPPESGRRAIPWIGNVQVFAWRTDVLGELSLEPPRTWDDVLANAGAITAAKGGAGLYGIGLRGQARNPAATSFLPVLRGHGADLFDDAWEPQLATPAALAALTTHLALARLAPPGVETAGHEEHGRDLAEGRIAQSGDAWADQLLSLVDPGASAAVGKVEFGSEPAQPGVRSVTMTGAWLLGIPKGSQNVEAAFWFLRWLTAPQQQKRLLLDHRIPPTRTSVLDDPDAAEQYPVMPLLREAIRSAVPRPRTPHYAKVEEICGGYVARAIAGQTTGEAALGNANREIRDYLVREGVLPEVGEDRG